MGLRLFIAVELSAAARAALAATSERLAAHWPGPAVRWTPPHQHHLTLRFLGDTEEALCDPLQRVLDETASAAAPLRLRLGEVGAFPATGRPRVLWAGLEGEALPALMDLHRRLEGRLRELGWASEGRPFRPHLTLGRIRREAPGVTGDWRRQRPAPVAVAIEEFVLMRSDLHRDGAIHTVMHRARLAA